MGREDVPATWVLAAHLAMIFHFMFFDALKPFIYGDFRAFYVFWSICTGFRRTFFS